MQQDYNNTINLPKTEFPMRAGLPKREPGFLENWEKNDLYHELMKKNEGKPLFVLHDGPPYANGNLHMGHALNKILKDFILRSRNMMGYQAPYIPGWDTHGLPIELKAMKSIGVENGAISPVELRKHCHDFAMMHVQNQMKQFKRLGTIGDYDYPYLTLRPEFEARQVEVFGEMAKRGYMYKGLKPVYWCPDCNTALAEAEIEYSNDPCYSIYVKFNVTDDKGIFSGMGLDTSKIYFVIWTTTTWTIPGNLAICLGPEYNYTLVHVGDEYYVMAEELVKTTMETAGITEYTTEGIFTGAELEGMKTKHPLYDRPSPIIVGDHVTLESGTGCVHTAPGYGVEDFEVCKNYDNIGIIVCVDAKGRQTAEAGEFEGMDTDTANKAIAAKLTEVGAMLATQKIVHQYPHCWRCNSPIIYRATEQWFCSVNDFKDEAIKAIEEVQWIPEWGEDRIKGMVRDRSDWCISRQRTWGVPIPIVYCKDCGKPIVNDETISAIADLFRKEGSDAWWTREASEFIPASVKCECGCSEFTKEYDIMDVWFDSGSSHMAVAAKRPELSWPVAMYLEGSDQHRGWFQSSLLTSVAVAGRAPYESVLTHGYVVDGDGRKMSKSVGNVIVPQDVIKQYGADIIRLWTASSDYKADIRISPKILKQLAEVYRKIRNTIRYILGNTNDFNYETDAVPFNEMLELDQWALMHLQLLKKEVTAAYESYDFHVLYHAIHNFCTVEMSSFYLDILKDRLYAYKADSKERRSAQTAMHEILMDLIVMLSPVLSFTMEEVWQFMKKPANAPESVQMLPWPEVKEEYINEELETKWDNFIEIRSEITKVLELARRNKQIGHSLDAKVELHAEGEALAILKFVEKDLATLLIVSQAVIVEGAAEGAEATGREDLKVTVAAAEGHKCERCWIYSDEVGQDAEHPTLCKRCAEAVKA